MLSTTKALQTIKKNQNSIKCLTCSKWFHAATTCIKSFHNSIDKSTTDFCQICLAKTLPFQALDDLDYEFTVLKGENISEYDMDRLRNLKFNPFDTFSIDDHNVALSENNTYLEESSKIECEYYFPNDLNKQINKRNLGDSFSIMHLNIQSMNNKFDSFKQLIN